MPSSGFTEFEIMAAAWSKKQKLQAPKPSIIARTADNHFRVEKTNLPDFRGKSNCNNVIRSSSQDRRQRRENRIEFGENGEVIGRDPAIRGRTRSRSVSEDFVKYFNGRKRRRGSSRSSSLSSGERRRGRMVDKKKWTHDKFSGEADEM